MKNIIKMIKKFIPEIIAVVVIIALMIGYGIATKRIHSNSVYDGNYVGGNSTDAYVSVDVKWIPSVEEAPGVDKVEFSENSEFKGYQMDAILEEDGWYWLSYEAQINAENGYHEMKYDNILVSDIWSGDLQDVLVFTVEDGIGYISDPSENASVNEEGFGNYPIVCEIFFSYNGARFSVSEWDVGVSIYLEKNGNLTAYNLQITQVCILGTIAVVGMVYIIYAFLKNKFIYMVAMVVLLLLPFGLSMGEFKDNTVGEWRSVEDENVIAMIPRHDKENYIQISGSIESINEPPSIQRDFFDESPGFDTDSKDFKEEYKRFDVIPGYELYPFVFVLDVIAGAVFVVVGKFYRGKNTTVQTNKVGCSWEFPYGEYMVSKVKYLPEAFKGMEEYFIGNLASDKAGFLMTEFSFDETTVANPVYTHTYSKMSIYNGATVEKCHNITIADEDSTIEYDMCFTAKGSYIRKKMGDMITVVYEIKTKEG